jgi:hypothetical protein
VGAKVCFQITISHQLHDNESRLSLGHNAKQLDDVMGIEFPIKQTEIFVTINEKVSSILLLLTS